jgi:hypothetical protein
LLISCSNRKKKIVIIEKMKQQILEILNKKSVKIGWDEYGNPRFYGKEEMAKEIASLMRKKLIEFAEYICNINPEYNVDEYLKRKQKYSDSDRQMMDGSH